MAFDYSGLKKLPYKKHKFFGGNHDNYDEYPRCPHALGDFGRFNLGKLSFYFIRGAFSIDVAGRLKAERRGHPQCWWQQEQLDRQKMYEAFEDYKSRRPHTMITHTCPTEIARRIGKPDALKMFGYDHDTFTTNTQELMQSCFDEHQPDVWIFGHFHRSHVFRLKGTLFICLESMNYGGYLDTDAKGYFNHKGTSGRLGQ